MGLSCEKAVVGSELWKSLKPFGEIAVAFSETLTSGPYSSLSLSLTSGPHLLASSSSSQRPISSLFPLTRPCTAATTGTSRVPLRGGVGGPCACPCTVATAETLRGGCCGGLHCGGPRVAEELAQRRISRGSGGGGLDVADLARWRLSSRDGGVGAQGGNGEDLARRWRRSA